MEKKGKGKVVLIVILLLALLGVSGYVVYDKFISKENDEKYSKLETKYNKLEKQYKELKENEKQENTQPAAYNYSNIKGLYAFTGNVVGEVTPEYKLNLYENGMFYYNYNTQPGGGKIGNYIINNNTIVLNYLFSTNMDVSLTTLNETNTLIINQDGSLTDNNQPISIVTDKTITLKKTTSDVNYQDVQNKLKNAFNR